MTTGSRHESIHRYRSALYHPHRVSCSNESDCSRNNTSPRNLWKQASAECPQHYLVEFSFSTPSIQQKHKNRMTHQIWIPTSLLWWRWQCELSRGHRCTQFVVLSLSGIKIFQQHHLPTERSSKIANDIIRCERQIRFHIWVTQTTSQYKKQGRSTAPLILTEIVIATRSIHDSSVSSHDLSVLFHHLQS